jgi:hypothetical protein
LGVRLLVATRAGVGLGVAGGGVVGLVVTAGVVIDGTTTSVGVILVVDVIDGVLAEVKAEAGEAVAPIAIRVAIEPTAETGRIIFFGNRGAVGGPSRDRPNPVCQSANATQRVTGQKNINATPMAIPTQSHLRFPG